MQFMWQLHTTLYQNSPYEGKYQDFNGDMLTPQQLYPDYEESEQQPTMKEGSS